MEASSFELSGAGDAGGGVRAARRRGVAWPGEGERRPRLRSAAACLAMDSRTPGALSTFCRSKRPTNAGTAGGGTIAGTAVAERCGGDYPVRWAMLGGGAATAVDGRPPRKRRAQLAKEARLRDCQRGGACVESRSRRRREPRHGRHGVQGRIRRSWRERGPRRDARGDRREGRRRCRHDAMAETRKVGVHIDIPSYCR